MNSGQLLVTHRQTSSREHQVGPSDFCTGEGPSGSAPDSLDLVYPVDLIQTSGCEMAMREGILVVPMSHADLELLYPYSSIDGIQGNYVEDLVYHVDPVQHSGIDMAMSEVSAAHADIELVYLYPAEMGIHVDIHTLSVLSSDAPEECQVMAYTGKEMQPEFIKPLPEHANVGLIFSQQTCILLSPLGHG
ncbi:hypothetical protein ARMGADRAFT_1038597 [Armillaria gallica]|uniref:Uncharacterized protein n=1 Tax=Armillaria gallica TaxID=47427 RepID=A0A2H3D0A0_ARMGA|nr:hypothetical protein ARMGADRAFT_1038597 [Armillaria gallica]